MKGKGRGAGSETAEAAIARHDEAAKSMNDDITTDWFREAERVAAEAKAAAAAVKPGARFAGAISPKSLEALHAMRAAGRTPYLGPFSSRVTADMASLLWREVEPFVNGGVPNAIDAIDGFDGSWSQLRSFLDGIIAGKPPLLSEAKGG